MERRGGERRAGGDVGVGRVPDLDEAALVRRRGRGGRVAARVLEEGLDGGIDRLEGGRIGGGGGCRVALQQRLERAREVDVVEACRRGASLP
eukprot:6983190-Prymnesium_polylepis.1